MLRLNESVTGKKRSAVNRADASTCVCKMVDLLATLKEWVDGIPRLEKSEPGRFGNRAFRSWHSRLVDRGATLLGKVINPASDELFGEEFESKEEVCLELVDYLKTSFGNETRLDYGSGHEAHFLVLLFCLWKVGVFTEEDDEFLVLLVFPRYLEVTRALQNNYNLEPAGSHGVWGLDDFSFLPFLWGSAQLLGRSSRVLPTLVTKDELVGEYRDEYLYVDAIGVIKEVKTGAFFEHSPMLHDISQVPAGWPKINQGMIKMYKGEVWKKRQVIQHVLFGNIFRFERRVLEEKIDEDAEVKVTEEKIVNKEDAVTSLS